MSLVSMNDVQRDVRRLQQARKALHQASASSEAPNTAQDGSKARPKPQGLAPAPRTVDAPALAVLKSVNYPFSVCEEAPASYVPPAVPFDVASEVELMRAGVERVQASLRQRLRQLGKNREEDEDDDKEKREEVLQALESDAEYASLAWGVSSLQWFYRWVLTHSISHLWNVKEAVEFVLSEDDAPLPTSPREMDLALAACPFSEAINVLDNDRIRVVAAERTKLSAAAEAGRLPGQAGLPGIAVTAATSSYLTDEEKVAYQAFFNQSEHLLLLLNHAVMLDRAAGEEDEQKQQQQEENNNNNKNKKKPQGSPSPSRGSGVLTVGPAATGGFEDTEALASEARAALAAEADTIAEMLSRIDERRKQNIRFVPSQEERKRSRLALLSVYGCVLSDLNIMGTEIDTAAAFFADYTAWLRGLAFESHDALMRSLSQRAGGTRWPALAGYRPDSAVAHSHFCPPTQRLSERRQQEAQKQLAIKDRSRSRHSHRDPQNAYTRTGGRTLVASRPAPPPSSASRPRDDDDDDNNNNNNDDEDRKNAAPRHSNSRKKGRQPQQQQQQQKQKQKQGSPEPAQAPRSRARQGSTISVHSSPPAGSPEIEAEPLSNALAGLLTAALADAAGAGVEGVGRVWQAAAVHYVCGGLAQRRWAPAAVLASMGRTEDSLLDQLRAARETAPYVPHASALVLALRELASLVDRRRTPRRRRGPVMDVLVPVHVVTGVEEAGEAEPEDLAAEMAYVRTPVERARWTAVVDALWLQCDPSGAASGGLLNVDDATAANRDAGAAGFLRIESVTVPARAADADPSDPPCLCLHYRTAAGSLTVGRLGTDEGGILEDPAARTAVAVRVLEALHAVERRGLLPCYACRVDEASAVPLAEMIFVHLADTERLFVSFVPPPAVALCRLDVLVGSATALDGDSDKEEDDDELREATEVYAGEVNFTTVPIAVADALAALAEQPPVLAEVYMLSETVREQALYDVRTRRTPPPFARAVASPVPVTCAPSRQRAGDRSGTAADVARSKNTGAASFVKPLLDQLLSEEGWREGPAMHVGKKH